MFTLPPISKTWLEKALAIGVASKTNAPAYAFSFRDLVKSGITSAQVTTILGAVVAALALVAKDAPQVAAWLTANGIATKAVPVLLTIGGGATALIAFVTKLASLFASGPRITTDPNDPARHDDPAPTTTTPPTDPNPPTLGMGKAA